MPVNRTATDRPARGADTRHRLLEAIAEEVAGRTFQSTATDDVLRRAGLTKGALYHHFGSKQKLGYAMVEEVIAPRILRQWCDPVVSAADPIAALVELSELAVRRAPPDRLAVGCPLNNLAQELSASEPGFRRRLSAVFETWRERLSGALERGQRRGSVGAEHDPGAIATFVVAAWEGIIGFVKVTRSPDDLAACQRELARYLRSLRPSRRDSSGGGERREVP